MKARQVFIALMASKGYTGVDLAMDNDKYSVAAMQMRWNYFLLGWEMRGVGFFPDSSMVGKDISGFFAPDKVVIKCKHCGQWGARFCECRKCGAPIE